MSSAALKAVATRTSLAPSPQETILQDLLARPFDPDAWHAMNERDNQLIEDEIAHGATSKAFVYEFEMQGKKVSGVSVIGARELASQYKGLKSKIVATIEKRGAMFIFRTFTPLAIEVRTITELEEETDFYECVLELSDIKTGNSLEVRKKETRTERKRDGGTFDRQHFDVIAESKAYRNGVLNLLPQSVVQAFKKKCLEAGNSENVETIDQIRAKVLTFGAKNAVPMNRAALGALTFAEISGLGSAARESLDAFKRAAVALNLTGGAEAPADAPPPPPAQPQATTEKKGNKTAKAASAPAAAPAPAPEQVPKKTYAQLADMVLTAGDAESAALFLDQARGELSEELLADLGKVYANKWGTV